MSEIEENIRSVRASLPPAVELVAVSKTHPVEAIREAYRAGQRVFGENKVQEMCAKQPELPGDVHWHLIGHLQSNKVKYIVPFVEMIQSVDSAELLAKIDAAAGKVGRRIDCLLEVRIACEETKYGLEPEAALALALSEQTRRLEHVRVRGLMGMASNTPDREQVRALYDDAGWIAYTSDMDTLKALWDRLREQDSTMDVLSMGMSGDYPIAVECGSTMVRVGSRIFGARNYNV